MMSTLNFKLHTFFVSSWTMIVSKISSSLLFVLEA